MKLAKLIIILGPRVLQCHQGSELGTAMGCGESQTLCREKKSPDKRSVLKQDVVCAVAPAHMEVSDWLVVQAKLRDPCCCLSLLTEIGFKER